MNRWRGTPVNQRTATAPIMPGTTGMGQRDGTTATRKPVGRGYCTYLAFPGSSACRGYHALALLSHIHRRVASATCAKLEV